MENKKAKEIILKIFICLIIFFISVFITDFIDPNYRWLGAILGVLFAYVYVTK